jgi:hypothetical protein
VPALAIKPAEPAVAGLTVAFPADPDDGPAVALLLPELPATPPVTPALEEVRPLPALVFGVSVVDEPHANDELQTVNNKPQHRPMRMD